MSLMIKIGIHWKQSVGGTNLSETISDVDRSPAKENGLPTATDTHRTIQLNCAQAAVDWYLVKRCTLRTHAQGDSNASLTRNARNRITRLAESEAIMIYSRTTDMSTISGEVPNVHELGKQI